MHVSKNGSWQPMSNKSFSTKLTKQRRRSLIVKNAMQSKPRPVVASADKASARAECDQALHEFLARGRVVRHFGSHIEREENLYMPQKRKLLSKITSKKFRGPR